MKVVHDHRHSRRSWLDLGASWEGGKHDQTTRSNKRAHYRGRLHVENNTLARRSELCIVRQNGAALRRPWLAMKKVSSALVSLISSSTTPCTTRHDFFTVDIHHRASQIQI